MTFLPLVFLAYAVVAFAKPRWAFLLFVAFLPAYLIRFPLGGIPTTALEVMFAILVVAWMRKREKRLIDIKGWGALLLLWLGVATLQLFVSPDFRAAAGVWKAYFIEPAIFFLMACDFLRTREDRDQALRALGGTALVVGALALVQNFTGWGVPPPFNGVPIPPAAEAEFRSTAFYGYPNAIGLFLGPLVPIFVMQAWLKRTVKKAGRAELWFWSGAALLSVAALFAAESEGALIGVAAGLGFLGLAFRKTRLPTLIGGALLTAALLLAPPTRGVVIEKLTLDDWSGRVRKEIWAETWDMLKDRPLLGAGLSGYPIVFAPYHKAGHIEIFQYPHTLILNFWVELGLAGLIGFGLLVWRFMAGLRRACFRDPTLHPWTVMLGASMVALLVHGLVDVPYFKNDLSMLFWLMLAMASSLEAETRRR